MDKRISSWIKVFKEQFKQVEGKRGTVEEAVKASKKSRPTGVKVICVILVAVVMLQLLCFLYTAQMLNFSETKKRELIQSRYHQMNINSIEDLDSYLKSTLKDSFRPRFIIPSILSFILAFGLWNMANWARVCLIFASCSFLLLIINSVFRSGIVNSILTYSFIVVSVAFIYYLTRPKVKEQFK